MPTEQIAILWTILQWPKRLTPTEDNSTPLQPHALQVCSSTFIPSRSPHPCSHPPLSSHKHTVRNAWIYPHSYLHVLLRCNAIPSSAISPIIGTQLSSIPPIYLNSWVFPHATQLRMVISLFLPSFLKPLSNFLLLFSSLWNSKQHQLVWRVHWKVRIWQALYHTYILPLTLKVSIPISSALENRNSEG